MMRQARSLVPASHRFSLGAPSTPNSEPASNIPLARPSLRRTPANSTDSVPNSRKSASSVPRRTPLKHWQTKIISPSQYLLTISNSDWQPNLTFLEKVLLFSLVDRRWSPLTSGVGKQHARCATSHSQNAWRAVTGDPWILSVMLRAANFKTRKMFCIYCE